MNPWSGTSWLWRAWRRHSVTFAALFALSVLGISVLGTLRHLLYRLGAPWYLLLIAPFLLLALLSRKEVEWIPDPEDRRIWARRLVLGSLGLMLLLAWFAPRKPPPTAPEPRPPILDR